MTNQPFALDRKTMTAPAMWVFAVAASALPVVLLGSIPATYASTGVLAVPLVFLLVGAVVGFLSVGYTEMSRQAPHPAVYYAAVAKGLGKSTGVAAGFIALLAYNGIQTSLYGLLGAQLSDTFGGKWWVGALIVAVLIAAFGSSGITRSTVVLSLVLAVSVLVVVMFVIAAVQNPALPGNYNPDGFSTAGLTGGIGGAAAYVLASLMGFEAGASFSEEARTPRGPGRSVSVALLVLVVVYAVVAWAVGVAVGPGQVTTGLPDPMDAFDLQYGPLMPPFVTMVLIFAIITSMLALHSIAARYGFGMAREGVLPRWVGSTGRGARTGAPVGGSLLQSGIAVVVIVVFAVLDLDPLASLFAWFSTVGALGLMTLLILTSISAMRYLREGGPAQASGWKRVIAPGLGVAGGLVVLVLMVVNADALLGSAPGSSVPLIIPAVVVACAIAGLFWAGYLRSSRPEVWEQIGQGQGNRHAVPAARLADIEL
ncbi:APC family permease [Winogradskya consettensis]|uniref:Amino acid permease n=1 Tax=Winogradskya consettensis TaxID=113560 RepID=A0A919W012_9ACTN|nr:APC family permease [Actinoplanes consettensis]GIM83018.1 amino acid permease [Actinoplanes consettensis]